MQEQRERTTLGVAALLVVVALAFGAVVLVLSEGPAARAGTSATTEQPYGGCDEAWQAPSSPGADLCRALGYSVSARFVLSPRGVVLHSSLPHCRFEDGSGGRRPCTWNVGPRTDGNGIGLAYKVRPDMTVRYVWDDSPAVDGWRWVSARGARRLASRFTRPVERRSVTAWQRCVVRGEGTTRVKCPDGARYVV